MLDLVNQQVLDLDVAVFGYFNDEYSAKNYDFGTVVAPAGTASFSVDGEVLDANGVNALAAIPSKEQLICKMLGSLMSPLYGFARVLQAKIDKDTEGAPAEA